ncbi:DNA polymerase delta subunit 2 [Heterostelium album PN500]|uniref:DNA polymerase delta subunit 2 n=1 Tax=Heterostelium pallidum (strain ATCC 26659 / Pp 5 / PN500) TaxID=670386 RepID=D3B0K1_HETP5|nr:DNA polymerase delta subunit 2 [Heterostelium album PN500]EFA84825.1 DNA polymerase delta subunit 2 [Heterostelium album PN500]|eukprot:XP_020436936.1 DNA polymerase delta subunit 2 [Heterostelium album PN500]
MDTDMIDDSFTNEVVKQFYNSSVKKSFNSNHGTDKDQLKQDILMTATSGTLNDLLKKNNSNNNNNNNNNSKTSNNDNNKSNQSVIKRIETTYNYSKTRFSTRPKDILESNINKDTIKTTATTATNSATANDATMRQFNKIYYDRLEKFRPILFSLAETKYPGVSINKILHLKPGEECILIGTLYKEMPLKPNILKQYAQDKSSLIDVGDLLILEDETGRVKLVGDKSLVDSHLTGLGVAIRGVGLASAEFEIKEIFTPGLPPQPYLRNFEKLEDDTYVCIVSGLNVGNPNSILSTNLLTDFISGNLGSPSDQYFSSRIARLIIAGDSIYKEADSPESFMKYRTKQEIHSRQQKIALPIKEFDSILAELCQSIPVDVLPGESDPTNLSLPQLPLNFCQTPFSVQNANYNPVSNPYESEIGGRIFLGTSGQNIENAIRYINIQDKIELMHKMLIWRHLAPTAPDTLACSPLEHDPFIIEQCPHVYFIGNNDRYETKLIQGEDGEQIRLILVPKFVDTNTVILVNLKTLDTFPIIFNF